MRQIQLLVASLFVGLALAGCLSDNGDTLADDEDPTQAQGAGGAEDPERTVPPERVLPDVVTKLTEVTFGDSEGGQGIWIHDDIAYVSNGGGQEAVAILDIANPEMPRKLGNITGVHSTTGGISARDIDILTYEDGRIVAALSQGGPMLFFDVTDPANPVELARFNITSHNLAAHDPAKLVYNSRSLGAPTGGVEIFDASDPDDIKLARVWEFENVAEDGTPVANTGCHDIKIYPEQERAYCGAVTQTLIWDMADPLNPVILNTIDNPLINIHHSIFTIRNHEVLVIGDEYGGAALYACYANVDSPLGGDISAPTGAVWLYDLTTPVPTLLSWLSPPPVDNAPRTCTAHFGWPLGDDSADMFVYGWYTAGVLLVDASDPMQPFIQDQESTGGTVWDAQYYKGYVYTGDGALGMGVYRPE